MSVSTIRAGTRALVAFTLPLTSPARAGHEPAGHDRARWRRLRVLLGCSALLIAAGCTAPRDNAACPERRPLGSEFPTYQPPQDPPPHDAPLSAVNESSGELTLRDALALALIHSPKLAATSWSVRIAEARTLQAGLRPNPELEAEVEDVAGSGDQQGFGAAVTTIRLSQLVDLGRKRSARTRVAALDGGLAGWDHETERLAVLTDATLAFVDLLAAQERLAQEQDSARLAEQILATVTQRVDAGKGSPLEKTKAAVELASARIALAKVESALRTARKRLAAIWGSLSPRFAKATGAMEQLAAIPSFERIDGLLNRNPDMARWAQEMEQRLAALNLERARRVPDLTVGVGVQRFEATRDHALTFGLSLPLPLFDRNQGGVLEAQYRLAQASHQRRDAAVRASSALAETHEALLAARLEALGLKNDVVPAASQAFDAAREGYQLGKFGYLEVLDAQRTLFDARAQLLNAFAQYHRALVIVESLIGMTIDSLNNESQKEQKP